jgi:CBS domain containing-hemolysin-like protein
VATWAGFILSVLAAFTLSLFHMILEAFSKISLSRFLEERETPGRQDYVRRFDDIRTAVDFWRMVFIIAVLVYLFLIVRRAELWPLWTFLCAVLGYAVVFDGLARILGTVFKNRLILFFLPSARLLIALSWPGLVLSRWLCAREERSEQKEEDREAGDEELSTFLDAAQEEGIIEKSEEPLLRSVVEFGDVVVREIMTSRVDIVCIRRDATIQKLRNLIITEKYSRIPVYKDRVDNTDGIVMAKDLLPYSDARFDQSSIEPLIRPAVFVPESMKVADLLKELQRVRQKMAIVVDEHGGVSGLVTMEDVVEEIVGEIQDEYDVEEAPIQQVGTGDYVVSGGAKVEELETLFGRGLAGEDFLTASGLITHELGRLPEKGELLHIRGLTVEVLDVDQKRIKKLRIQGVPAASPETE